MVRDGDDCRHSLAAAGRSVARRQRGRTSCVQHCTFNYFYGGARSGEKTSRLPEQSSPMVFYDALLKNCCNYFCFLFFLDFNRRVYRVSGRCVARRVGTTTRFSTTKHFVFSIRLREMDCTAIVLKRRSYFSIITRFDGGYVVRPYLTITVDCVNKCN